MVALRAKKAKKGFSLFIDIYQNGKRQKEYLKLSVSEDYTQSNKDGGKKRIKSKDKDIWELAEKIRSQRELEIKNTEFGFISGFKQNACFVQYFENKAKIKANKSYQGTLKHLREFTSGSITFRAFNEAFLQDFQTYLKDKVSDNTNITYIQRLQVIWNEAAREKIVERNPFLNLTKLKKQTPKREFLTIAELQSLASTDAPNLLVKNLFLFASFTGLRLSDCQKLTWQEVKENALEFRQKKSSKDILIIPLHNNALNILESLPKDSDLVFAGLPSEVAINNSLRIWAKTAKITKHLHFHISRHTFATMALSSDVDIFTVSKLLGHADLKTTQIYAKLIDDKKREAINKMPEIKLG